MTRCSGSTCTARHPLAGGGARRPGHRAALAAARDDPQTFLGLLADIDGGESKIALEATLGWERSPAALPRDARAHPRARAGDSTLVLIADLTRKIERTKREIDTCASDDPHFEVLCQIRGVDRYIAMLVIADVGDVSRLRARAISAPGPG